jgi:hypothetical protein
MGFWIQPRQRVDGDLRFAVIGPDGLGLPLRLLTQSEAEQLAGLLNQYLDDETPADMPAAGTGCGPSGYAVKEAQRPCDPARQTVSKPPSDPLPIRPCCFAR